MTISGNLRSLELSELLQWLSQGRKTGTLVVTNGRAEKKIILRNGRIISSASTDPSEHLGEFLVSRGYIDRTTLDHARKLQEATQIFLGKVLVTLDSLSQVDLERIMREKTEESVFDLFRWKEGEFEFLRDELPNLAMVPLSLDVTQVVMKGLRRLDESNHEIAGETEDRTSSESPQLESELETVPLADLVGMEGALPAAGVAPGIWDGAELREEALASLPETLKSAAAEGVDDAALTAETVVDLVSPPGNPPEGVDLAEQAVELPTEIEDAFLGGGSVYATALAEGSRRTLYLAVTAVLLAVAVAWGFLSWGGASSGSATAEASLSDEVESLAGSARGALEATGLEPTAAGVGADTPPPMSDTMAATEAETERIAAELDELVAARSRELESSLKAEYEAKLARLEKQLEAARRDAVEARELETAVAPAETAEIANDLRDEANDSAGGPGMGGEQGLEIGAASPSGIVLAASGPATSSSLLASQRSPAPPPVTFLNAMPGSDGSSSDSAAKPGRGPTRPLDAGSEAAYAGSGTEPVVRAPARVGGPEAASPAGTGSAQPPAGSVAPAPEVREGDLVARRPDVVAPRLLGQPRPLYPPAARRLRREGSVDIRVRVDEGGRAVEVRQLGKKAGLGFDKAALDAAALTTWEPATLNGVRVSTWVDLRIEFRP